MGSRRLLAAAAAAVAVLCIETSPAVADLLVYRCGPNICRAAPDGTGKQRLTTDGRPGGPLYSWLSASADGSRLAVVNATYAYVLDGAGRRITDKLPRGGIGVIAEIAPGRLAGRHRRARPGDHAGAGRQPAGQPRACRASCRTCSS